MAVNPLRKTATETSKSFPLACAAVYFTIFFLYPNQLKQVSLPKIMEMAANETRNIATVRHCRRVCDSAPPRGCINYHTRWFLTICYLINTIILRIHCEFPTHNAIIAFFFSRFSTMANADAAALLLRLSAYGQVPTFPL